MSCTCCKADGPVVMVEDYLNFSDEVTNEAWNEAVEKAKAAAVEKWNTRPPMTDVTAEERTEYEKFSEEFTKEAWNEAVKRAKAKFEKTHSAALYGANCREV